MVDSPKPNTRTSQPVQGFLSPASFIAAAKEAHPAFRYALAVAGIFAIVVIFEKFGVSLAGLVLGAIALIALMVVFLVFAQASKLTKAHLNLPAQVLVWAYLLMIIGASLLVIWSLFFNGPLPLRAWIVQKLSIPTVITPVPNESKPAAKVVPTPAPKPSQPRTIELSAVDNTCSFRDGVDFVSQKTEFQVQAICTGLSPNFQFTAKFTGVIKPDNPHGNGAWVDIWLTDSHKRTKALGQPNFTRRQDDDSIRPHDTTLTGEVPASGRVSVYLVLDHCQTWTYETTCTTIGNSHLLIRADPKT